MAVLGSFESSTVKKLCLDAPLPVLIDRVKARVGDASDVDERAVRR